MNAWVTARRLTVVVIGTVATVGGVAAASAGPNDAGVTTRAGATAPKIISIVPQGAFASTQSAYGPVLSGTSTSSMRVGFVIPPDRTSTKPLKMRVVYLEDSAGACAWVVSGSGLEGPDGPNTENNVHNGGWQPPGDADYTGPVSVPAGDGSAHTAVFRWPFDALPHMFVQFALDRAGSDPADTCGAVTVVGLELRY